MSWGQKAINSLLGDRNVCASHFWSLLLHLSVAKEKVKIRIMHERCKCTIERLFVPENLMIIF